MTKIEWTQKTWNVVSGCTKCSPGCENCYAEVMARRLQANPKTREKYWRGFDVMEHWDSFTVEMPRRWKKPRMVFVCSMGDLFHPMVDNSFITRVMGIVRQTPHHTYQILTKRPHIMRNYFAHHSPPDNVWLGVTVCNQAEADEKIPVLLGIPATVRFVSVEPMLEPVDLRLDWRNDTARWDSVGRELPLRRISWVICGGETGANARPMNPDWARSLRDQCKVCDVPFFFKQMAKRQPIPDDLLIREFPKGGTEHEI